MADICKRCGRPRTRVETDKKTGVKTRTNRRKHECEIARLVRPSERDERYPYVKEVALSRVEPDGDLYAKTHGKKPEWEIIYRSTTKLEKSVASKRTKGKEKLRSRRQQKKQAAKVGGE